MTKTSELKFSDFDQKSQKELLERRASLIKTTSRKIQDCHDEIKHLIDDGLFWMDLCKDETEKEEIRKNTAERILEVHEKLIKYRLMKNEIELTEPHKLKAVYILSQF